MIALLQRVLSASVTIDNEEVANIKNGLLILLGITHSDSQEDIDWLTKKISSLRVFSDENGKMNAAIKEVNGEILVVSQFTLHASTKKGNRPSFIEAASPDLALSLYQSFIQTLQQEIVNPIQSGKFGADMKVSLLNDGPVTIVIDTKNKE
jgi:D-tyrosyl-tRNA(Tyr) deacylase